MPKTDKPVTSRRKNRLHPLLRDRPRGHFYPDLVGKVPGYPKTYEAWKKLSDSCRAQVIRLNAEGKAGRQGVPDGWAGRKAELLEVQQRSAVEAKRAVQMMIENDMIDTPEDPRVEQALQVNVEIMLAVSDEGKPAYTGRERTAASRVILDFLKAKPVIRQDIAVARAEDFLAVLAAKD